MSLAFPVSPNFGLAGASPSLLAGNFLRRLDGHKRDETFLKGQATMNAPFVGAQVASHERVSEQRKIVTLKLNPSNPFRQGCVEVPSTR